VLILPWYNPVLLGRRLSTLDVLSGGRLRVGFGVGWLPDEFEAVGVPWAERGKRADEALQALKAIWTTDPVNFQGKFYDPAIDGFLTNNGEGFVLGYLFSGDAAGISLEVTAHVVPEPTTLLLWGTTMAGLGLAARWRRRRQN
jgi:MYXO-CTERM domain-containing protein